MQKWYIETPTTPIYSRITQNLHQALAKINIKIIQDSPAKFKHYLEYLKYLKELQVSHFLITNQECIFYSYLEKFKKYFFELLPGKLIFIHHDSLAPPRSSFKQIRLLFDSFYKVKDKSIHLCLENYNLQDLKKIGLPFVYKLFHATEFKPIENKKSHNYDLSFIGHVLPSEKLQFNNNELGRQFKSDFLARSENFTHQIEDSANNFAKSNFSKNDLTSLLAGKYFYISNLHYISQRFRGEVLKKIKHPELHIFGGDPSYLNQISRNSKIKQANIVNHPPLYDVEYLKSVIVSTKINLNLTSLQFDSAVINRVLDVGAAGGFILTDFKQDLKQITSFYREISFKSPQDMDKKIHYYLNHPEKRKSITKELSKTVREKFNYNNLAKAIIKYSEQTFND